ncbi:MAG: VTT domain-containing protein [Candidatus Paceibacterota bacterium]
MENFPAFISYSLAFAEQYKYIFIFLGAIIEGPILMVATGFFLKLGVFSLIPLYIALVLGDIVADIGWYYIGYFFAEPILRKHGTFFGVTPELFEKTKDRLRRHRAPVLLISKISIGFGFALATLVAAGVTKIPIRFFVIINAIGEIFLVAMLMSIGYFFGHFYSNISNGFNIALIAGVGLFLLILAYGYSNYIRSKMLKI